MADATKAQIASNLKLFKDNIIINQLPFKMNAVSYVESNADRFILAVSSGWQAFPMNGVDTGAFLAVETDRPILISLDTTTRQWALGRDTKGGMVTLLGAFSHVYLRNNSVTNVAVVSVLIADES